MLQGILDAILIHRRSDIIGYRLHIVASIAHGNTDSGFLDDGDVIAAIPKSHRLAYLQTKILSHGVKPLALIGITCRDVGKSRMPSSRSTIIERRHQCRLLRLATERSELQDILTSQIFETDLEVKGIYPQALNEDFLYDRREVVDGKMFLSHHNHRIAVSIRCRHHLFHICTRNRTLTNSMVPHEAAGTIGGDITIDEMLYLTEIGDDQLRATSGNIYLYSIFLCPFECIDSALRYAVSLKTDKRAIYIEKQSFDSWIAHNSTYFIVLCVQNYKKIGKWAKFRLNFLELS